MTCPACGGTSFAIQFVGDTIIPSGSVLVVCQKCNSEWDGHFTVDRGRMHGPCCADGYGEEG